MIKALLPISACYKAYGCAAGYHWQPL